MPWAARWQARQIGTRFQDSRGPPRPTGISSWGSTAHCWHTGLIPQAMHRPPCRPITFVSRSMFAAACFFRCFGLTWRIRRLVAFGFGSGFGWAKPDQSIPFVTVDRPVASG